MRRDLGVEDLAVERFVSGGDSLFDTERLKINRTRSLLLWSGRLRAVWITNGAKRSHTASVDQRALGT